MSARERDALSACVAYAQLVAAEWARGTVPPNPESEAGRIVAIGRAELADRNAELGK